MPVTGLFYLYLQLFSFSSDRRRKILCSLLFSLLKGTRLPFNLPHLINLTQISVKCCFCLSLTVTSRANLTHSHFPFDLSGHTDISYFLNVITTKFNFNIMTLSKGKSHPCTVTEALYRPYGPRGSRGIALPFHDHGTRRE